MSKADDNLKMLELMNNHLNTLTQFTNPTPFNTKFTGKHADTLSWIQDVDMYVDVQLVTNEKIAFRRIFMSLPEKVRELFVHYK